VLLPEADHDNDTMPRVPGDDHWRQFVEAVLGNGTTLTKFDYSGPLTEAVLLGSLATRFPQTTLQWNAAKLRFTNVREANTSEGPTSGARTPTACLVTHGQ
jgi:hypothetical protein